MSDATSSTAAADQKASQGKKHHSHNPVKRSVGLAGAITGDVGEFLGGNKNPAGGSVNAVAKGLNKAAGKGAQT